MSRVMQVNSGMDRESSPGIRLYAPLRLPPDLTEGQAGESLAQFELEDQDGELVDIIEFDIDALNSFLRKSGVVCLPLPRSLTRADGITVRLHSLDEFDHVELMERIPLPPVVRVHERSGLWHALQSVVWLEIAGIAWILSAPALAVALAGGALITGALWLSGKWSRSLVWYEVAATCGACGCGVNRHPIPSVVRKCSACRRWVILNDALLALGGAAVAGYAYAQSGTTEALASAIHVALLLLVARILVRSARAARRWL